MEVTIRLARHGSKKNPFYRIVAATREAPRNGKFLEILGTYDPRQAAEKIKVDVARLKFWIARGAVPSMTVGELIQGL